MSPSMAVILPRTRAGACAAAVSAATRSTSATLLRRIDAIFAYRDAAGHELAIVGDPRCREDRCARREIRTSTVDERVVLGLRCHQDLLLAVLVFHGELVAAARLRDVFDVGVG